MKKTFSLPVEKYITTYALHFTNNPSFVNQQFSRFVQKTQNAIIAYFDKEYPDSPQTSVEEWIAAGMYHYCINKFFLNQEPDPRDFSVLGRTYYIPVSIVSKEAHNTLLKAFEMPYLDTPNSLHNIIRNETVAACKQHIKERSFTEPDITKDNYMLRALPTTEFEICKLIDNIFNWSLIDLERLTANDLDISISNVIRDTETRMLQNRNDVLTAENERLEEKNTYLENALEGSAQRILNVQSENLKKQEPDFSYDDYQRYKSLEKKYNALQRKYETVMGENAKLKEKNKKMSSMIASVNAAAIDYGAFVDHNANYVFLINPDLLMSKNLKKVFPNCQILDQNKTLNPDNVDMVIVMTKETHHSLYYGIKAQCKLKGIPFIHSSVTNISSLEKLIVETSLNA